MELVNYDEGFMTLIQTHHPGHDTLHHVLFETKELVSQTMSFLGPSILIVLMTKVVHLIIQAILGVNHQLTSISTCLAGSYQIYQYTRNTLTKDHHTSNNMIITVILLYLSYAFLSLRYLNRHKVSRPGSLSLIMDTLVMFAPILYNEYLILAHDMNHHMTFRPILMTLSMKIKSITREVKEQTNLFKIWAYLVHPASCLFGPWHCYESVYESHLGFKSVTRQVSSFAKNIMFAFSALVIGYVLPIFLSSYLNADNGLNSLTTPVAERYLQAFEFRMSSHYFMCFMASSFLSLWKNPIGDDPQICRVSQIEWPRSLVQVVTNWNIPMHRWLKEYVFYPARARGHSHLTCILVTYMVSSLLHGFKFHIWAVLLTLGISSWIEYKLRANLSRKFKICIKAHECKLIHGKCMWDHKLTEANLGIRSLNILFRILAMAHLAYLGYIFQGNHDESSYREVIHLWSQTYFYSHILSFIALLINVKLVIEGRV